MKANIERELRRIIEILCSQLEGLQIRYRLGLVDIQKEMPLAPPARWMEWQISETFEWY
jgi:hypothetical protein